MNPLLWPCNAGVTQPDPEIHGAPSTPSQSQIAGKVSGFEHTSPSPYQVAPGQTHTQELSHVLFSFTLTKTGTRTEEKMARHPEGGEEQCAASSGAWNLPEGRGEAHPYVT